MQDGRNAGRLRAERVWEMFREVSRSAGMRGQRPDWLQAEVQEDWKRCREKGGLRLAEEPGKMQDQERSCKQGCSGSLGPYGCRPGPSIGLPAGEQGRVGPRQLPTGRKVLECRAEPLTYTRPS